MTLLYSYYHRFQMFPYRPTPCHWSKAANRLPRTARRLAPSSFHTSYVMMLHGVPPSLVSSHPPPASNSATHPAPFEHATIPCVERDGVDSALLTTHLALSHQ